MIKRKKSEPMWVGPPAAKTYVVTSVLPDQAGNICDNGAISGFYAA